MATLIRHDSSDFGILDKVAIRQICEWLPIIDTNNFKTCSKRLHKIIDKYLSDNCYRTDYITKQKSLLLDQMNRIDQMKEDIQVAMKKMDIYTLHNNIKPDGYMRFSFQKEWFLCNVENAFNICGDILYIKSGQPQKRYDKIWDKIEEYQWKRVFIPRKHLDKDPDIEIRRDPRTGNSYKYNKRTGTTHKLW